MEYFNFSSDTRKKFTKGKIVNFGDREGHVEFDASDPEKNSIFVVFHDGNKEGKDFDLRGPDIKKLKLKGGKKTRRRTKRGGKKIRRKTNKRRSRK
jgi:hypothetical protein